VLQQRAVTQLALSLPAATLQSSSGRLAIADLAAADVCENEAADKPRMHLGVKLQLQPCSRPRTAGATAGYTQFLEQLLEQAALQACFYLLLFALRLQVH
jgi:hypothetical protein